MNLEHFIAEAKTFTNPNLPFVPIGAVKLKPSKDRGWGFWSVNKKGVATIEGGLDLGGFVLAHEVFHSVFHGSPLQKFCNPWGEAFCNTFAHFVTGPEPRRRADVAYALDYALPSRILVDHCGNDYECFRLNWLRWNDFYATRFPTAHFLDEILGFRPGWGYLHAQS